MPNTPPPDTTQPPPEDLNARIDRYLAQLTPQRAYAPPPPVDRSTASLLGEALGGGTTGLAPADRESAGTRALLNFGLNMLSASGPSVMPRGFGQIFAQGAGGAQQSLGGSEAVAASRMAAQQAYEEKQQELTISRIKEAIPLLTLQANQRALAGMKPPGTSIAAAGAPPAVPEGAYGKGGPAADTKVPEEYLPFYQEASQRTGIPVDVLIAQARQESGFNADATGKAGEIGLHQIKPTTAADPGFGVRPVDPAALKDPRANINFAADYLKAHLPPGTDPTDPAALRVALKGYNGGGDPNYVANVTRYLPAPAPQKPADGGPPAAPFKVATAGAAVPVPAPGAPAAAPPAPGSVAAETAGLVVPSGATPVSGAPAAAPPAPDEDTYRPSPIPDEYKSLITGKLSPAQIQNLEAQKTGAQQNFKAAVARGDPAAAAKAQDDYNKILADENTMLQDQTDKGRDFLKSFYDNDYRIFEQKMKGRQAIDVERVKAGQTYHQKLEEQAATAAQENTIKPMSAAAMKAHQMNLGLSQMLPLLSELPKGGGLVGSLLNDHPDLAPLLNIAGVLNDKQADAVRLINGLVSNISTEMKPAGLGALREYEWDAFKAQLPNMLSTPAGQQKAVAMLMNMNNRIQQEASWMGNYFSRKIPDETTPGKARSAHNLESDNPSESIQQRMDRELGPIIPSFSGTLTGNNQAQWEQSLPPGKPYYKTWARPDPQKPGQPLRDQRGNVVTTKTLEVRPWE